MKTADIILAILVLATAAVLAVCLFSGDVGDEAVITVDGKEYGRYSLAVDREINVETKLGKNTVVIKNGKVTVFDADCPDGYCEDHVAIGKDGEKIVCLPNRLVVEIVGDSHG